MGEAERRARLTREFTQSLASDEPLERLWPRCAETLAALAGASSAHLVLGPVPQTSGESPDGVSIAIRRSSGAIGSIELAGAACDDEQRALLEACAFALAIRLDLAFTDPLTGIANRRSFEAALARAWSSAGRSQSPLAIALFEIEAFERYAAQCGHEAANECLQRVAVALDRCVGRPSDIVARYGDAAFVALLLDTTASSAADLTERMREAASRAAGIAVNAGSAARIPNREWQPGDLLHAARSALEVGAE
jgi:diguanylate cyclase (GGDEF)-like protein